jgi:uncharacterized protein YjbI with pentapeptide repeats
LCGPDDVQFHLLKEEGSKAWNEWRTVHRSDAINLSKANFAGCIFGPAGLRGANLSNANLGGANLNAADLSKADLTAANLSGAQLKGANLSGTDLSKASLAGADLSGADLRWSNLSDAIMVRTDLSEADLFEANLSRANLKEGNFARTNLRRATLMKAELRRAIFVGTCLKGTDFSGAIFSGTVLSNTDLSVCRNLEKTFHYGPSSIDIGTLRSGGLPFSFQRGIGLPDKLIEYLPSMVGQAIQHYSCFISYFTQDQQLADRLHADLQNRGIRCWFAPHDLHIGSKTWDSIDEAIRLRDKVLLILSQASISSAWVEDEVTKAFAEERRRAKIVLFPIRVDDAMFETNSAWAGKLRDNRNIGDFRLWKDHNAYGKALQRVLRDLRVETKLSAS